MTLNLSGPISIGNGVAGQDIALEFGLAANSVFPDAFYGKGGAPASGALKFSDFYGRSNNHSVVVSPDPVDFTGSSTSFSGGAAAGVVSGGVGPFNYAWVRTSGSNSITADSPIAAGTSFTVTAMGPGDTKSATFRLDVTDTGTGGSPVASSNIITVNAERV